MVWRRRHWLLAVIFCAYLLCYVDRMVMASAIPFIAKDFKLSPLVMGQVLSSFFIGYALTQIPGGMLVDRLGPRIVLTASITWWSVLTALTGAVPGLGALIAVRVLFGLGEGPFPSAASKSIALWFPRHEVGRANGILLASTFVGATAAPLFVAELVTKGSWRSVFYLLLVPGLPLALIVWRYLGNLTKDDRATGWESPLAQNSLSSTKQSVLTGIALCLRTPAVLWCAACLFLANMVSWGLMNWLPTYLIQGRGFSAERMGIFAAFTNFCGALGYPLGGYLCDRFFNTRLRIPIASGLLVSGGFIYLAAHARTGELASMYLGAVLLISNIAGAGIFMLPLVVVPKYAVGSAFGVVNTAGQLAGVVSPFLIGYVLEQTKANFGIMLYLLLGLTLLSTYPALRIRQPDDYARKIITT